MSKPGEIANSLIQGTNGLIINKLTNSSLKGEIPVNLIPKLTSVSEQISGHLSIGAQNILKNATNTDTNENRHNILDHSMKGAFDSSKNAPRAEVGKMFKDIIHEGLPNKIISPAFD